MNWDQQRYWAEQAMRANTGGAPAVYGHPLEGGFEGELPTAEEEAFGVFGEVPPQGGLSESVPTAAQFGTRSGNEPVAANATLIHPGNALYSNIVRPEASTYWPRCITAFSENQVPFDLEVNWTGGEVGAGGRVVITAVRGSTRVYIVATTLDIRAATWDNRQDTIYIGASDKDGSNNAGLHRVMRALALPGAGVVTNIGAAPPFARTVEALTDVPGQLAGLNIAFLDAAGNVMATFPGNAGRVLVPPCFGGVQIQNNNPGAVNSVVLDYQLDI